MLGQTRFYRLFAVALLFCLACPAVGRADDYDELLKLQKRLVVHRSFSQYDAAEKVGKEMVALAEDRFQDQPTVIADCLDQLISVYDLKDVDELAEPYCRRAIALREKALGQNSPELSYPLMVLGGIHRRQQRLADAERCYRRGVVVCEQAIASGQPAPISYLPILVNFAAILDDQNRYAEGEPLLRRALPIAEKQSGKSKDVATILNNLAKICSDQGQFAEATTLYQRSLTMKEQVLGKNHPEVATTLNNLGLTYMRAGAYQQAEPLYQRALAIAEKSLQSTTKAEAGYSSPQQSVCSALENLGNLCVEQERYREAEPYYQRALDFQEKFFGKDNPLTAQTLSNLAVLYEREGRYAEAEPLLDRAIRLVEGTRRGQSALYNMRISRSVIYWFTDRREQGLADLQQALEVAERMRVDLSGDETQRAEASAYQYGRAFELMIGCQRDAENVPAAFATIERWRARTLLEQISLQGVDLLAGLPSATNQALKERDAQTRARLVEIEKRLEALSSRQDLDLQAKQAEATRLEADLQAARDASLESYRSIRNASPAYRLMIHQDFHPVDLTVLHDWVKEREALLLEYVVGIEHIYLLAIPADGAPRLLMLPDVPAELAKVLGTSPGPMNKQRLQQALSLDGKPLAEVMKQPAARQGDLATVIEQGNALLWKLLIPEEFRDPLIKGTYKRFIVIPDAGLANFPFDALVVEPTSATNKRGVCLVDVGPPILTAPSATLLHNLATREPAAPKAFRPAADGKVVLSVGDPAYGAVEAEQSRNAVNNRQSSSARRAVLRSELTRLPYTGWETEWVAQTFDPAGLPTRKLKLAEATERAVRDNLPGRAIVHLACHGLADQAHGNLFGALALATPRAGAANAQDDGFLNLAEIYSLNAKGCELAILSACETNLGPLTQGEGVFALSRGFLVAGARRVVATNWVVDDESSASLVSYFCSTLAKQFRAGDEMDYALALQSAKRLVRKQDKWQHPYYWASFTLTGPN